MKKSFIIGKRNILLALLIVTLGVAVYFNWTITNKQQNNDNSAGTNLGDAVLVNAQAESSTESGESFFENAKKDREEARKKSLDELKELIEDPKTDSSMALEANAKSVEIAKHAEVENSIETLVKAKGFKECTAVISGDTVNVMVLTDKLLNSDTIQIQDIASTATGFNIEKIKIIQIKNS